MGLLDTFRGQQYKSELEALQEKYNNLEKMLTPEMRDVIKLQELISELENQKSDIETKIKTLNEQYEQNVSEQKRILARLESDISVRRQQIITFDDEILVQEFGLYSPRYDFANAEQYKDELMRIRNRQKECIKNDSAVTGNMNWTVNGNAAQGKKMIRDTQKLLLRAFNSECDETISKIKYNNIDASVKKIKSSAAAISKLGTRLSIAITNKYLDLKIKEAYLALEYQLKKQQEKEEAKEARAQMREAAKLQKEIEEQRKKVEKEQTHYQTAYENIKNQLTQNPNDPDLIAKKNELEAQLSEIEKSLDDIDYRAANAKAGYVYVISNIGAFGENIYKIGMTRRLDPQERVDELGDASVPFNFDVHAMIFSDNAPALEAALHRAFEDKKLNMVNHRREFFHVTLDEIKKVVKENYDKTVEFIEVPDAEQYRISQKMRIESGIGELSIQRSNMPAATSTPAQEIVSKQPPDPISENNQPVSAAPAAKLDPTKEYLHTKWGIYEMPEPYTLSLTKGPRYDLTQV